VKRIREIPNRGLIVFVAAALSVVGLALAGFGLSGHSANLQGIEQKNVQLRLADSDEDIIEDLNKYIPERMRQSGIPGVSVSLIRGMDIVWSEGFGVESVRSRKPITEDTIFEVASLGKVVAAYSALQFIEKDKLSLDDSISSMAPEPWFLPEDAGWAITLRQLLSHTSGLSNNSNRIDKNLSFPPGQEFAYSGVGYYYLQQVMEQISGKEINDLVDENIFTPIGMDQSSFLGMQGQVASGHIRYWIPLVAYLLLSLVIFGGWTILVSIYSRITSNNWIPRRKTLIIFLAISICLASVLPFLAGWSYLRLISLCGLIFSVICAAGVILGRFLLLRFLPTQKPVLYKVLVSGWTFLIVLVFILQSRHMAVPVPQWNPSRSNVAYTMRSTAPNLARFLIELDAPENISSSEIEEMLTPQVTVNQDISWGLGVGIQHSKYGKSIWHWGANRGFQSMMVFYPDNGIGIVVLTNSDNGLSLAKDVAQLALGGEANWTLE
jgi:CubicO group peptidase (beta-lactamase class C family)